MTFLQQKPRAGLVVALLLFLIAGFLLFRQSARTPHKEAIKTYDKNLILQAEKVTSVVPEGGNIVIMVFDGALKIAGSEKRYGRVFGALEKNGLSVLHVERLVFDKESGWNEFNEGFPYTEYLRVAGEHPDADAILSFCRLPYFPRGSGQVDVSAMPPLLLMRLRQSSDALQDMLDSGQAAAAVVPTEESLEQGSAASRVVAEYELLTGRGTVSSL